MVYVISTTLRQCAAVGFAVAAAIAGAVHSADFPSRPIRLIVPAPPGGTTDTLARVIGPRLAERLGQQVVVDNRGGAGGIVGAELLVRAAADGHTLAVAYTTHTVFPHLQKLSFDPLRDITPIIMVTSAPLVLVVPPGLGVSTVNELVALGRTKPLNFGSAGNGSGGHLSGELLKLMTGIPAQHIPYKGASPAATDLIAGQLQFQFASQITVQGFLKAGRLRALAVTSLQRARSLPDVPTVAESGLAGFEVVNWFGFIAPARLPDPIVKRINSDIAQVLQIADVQTRLTNEGSEIVSSTPQAFAAFLERDLAKWGKVVKAAGMRAD